MTGPKLGAVRGAAHRAGEAEDAEDVSERRLSGRAAGAAKAQSEDDYVRSFVEGGVRRRCAVKVRVGPGQGTAALGRERRGSRHLRLQGGERRWRRRRRNCLGIRHRYRYSRRRRGEETSDVCVAFEQVVAPTIRRLLERCFRIPLQRHRGAAKELCVPDPVHDQETSAERKIWR